MKKFLLLLSFIVLSFCNAQCMEMVHLPGIPTTTSSTPGSALTSAASTSTGPVHDDDQDLEDKEADDKVSALELGRLRNYRSSRANTAVKTTETKAPKQESTLSARTSEHKEIPFLTAALAVAILRQHWAQIANQLYVCGKAKNLTPLHAAVCAASCALANREPEATAEKLITTIDEAELSATINTPDEMNRTPLHYACFLGYPNLVTLLLRLGALITFDKLARFPSYYACGALIDFGELFFNNRTLVLEPQFSKATEKDRIKIIALLKQTNPDYLLLTTQDGATPSQSPLEYAKQKNFKEVVKYLESCDCCILL